MIIPNPHDSCVFVTKVSTYPEIGQIQNRSNKCTCNFAIDAFYNTAYLQYMAAISLLSPMMAPFIRLAEGEYSSGFSPASV